MSRRLQELQLQEAIKRGHVKKKAVKKKIGKFTHVITEDYIPRVSGIKIKKGMMLTQKKEGKLYTVKLPNNKVEPCIMVEQLGHCIPISKIEKL